MIDPTLVALVPVREPGLGKSRLADWLPPEARRSLASAMLADVLAAIRGAGIERVVVLASGPVAAATGKALGMDVLLDPPLRVSQSGPNAGLDAAIAAADARVGSATSLVVTADLPTLTPDDVVCVLATDGDVVIAPTRDGGTGGMLRRPGTVIPPAYGGRSAARHLLAARRAGRTAERVDLPGFAHDVDLRDDLDEVIATGRAGPATTHVLGTLGLCSA